MFISKLRAVAIAAAAFAFSGAALANDIPKGPLVTTEWLEKNLSNPNIRVVEVSVNPGVYEKGHIPGAVNFVWHTDLNDKVRRDIREGRPGTRLDLATTVVDVSTCKPIKGAAVDIWHCDAGGTYSGFAREGTDGDTFMRGIQRTTKTGLATFVTVYPGWYSGRTVHIHVQVSLGGNVLHTGQLFFPEQLTDAVYRRAPYNRRPSRDTRNATDSIFRNGGSKSMLKHAKTKTGYAARITMGISRS